MLTLSNSMKRQTTFVPKQRLMQSFVIWSFVTQANDLRRSVNEKPNDVAELVLGY